MPMRWSIGSTGKQISLGAFERNAQMTKTRPAALAALPEGSVLSLRTHPRNPNHHLWWNNGTWWLHATVHRPDYTKQRLRLPLETKSIHLARAQRDTLFAGLCCTRKEAA